MGWKYYSLEQEQAQDKAENKAEDKAHNKTHNKAHNKAQGGTQDKAQNKRQFHSLDQIAQTLVLDARTRDRKSLNQSFKMREAVAYGLERFWGEHLRLKGRSKKSGDEFDCKAEYWKATWNALVSIMKPTGVTIPNDAVDVRNPTTVKNMAEKLWSINVEDQRIILAVLTQLCDSIVWWTQRYKGPGDLPSDEEN